MGHDRRRAKRLERGVEPGRADLRIEKPPVGREAALKRRND